jgi:YD repeat-containing protein
MKTLYLGAAALMMLMPPVAIAANITWTGGGDGVSWSDANNWSGRVLPASGDDVTIGTVTGNPTIQFTGTAGLVQINSLTSSEPVTVSGGTLQVATTIQMSQNLTLAGGTIKGCTISRSGSATLLVSSGTLDGVSLNGDLTVQNGASLHIQNGLTLNNAKLILAAGSSGASVLFLGTQMLGGTGEVVFAGTNSANSIFLDSDAGVSALTIGPKVTVHGSQGGKLQAPTRSFTFINQGTIIADTAGATISIWGTSFTNQGAVSALNGGTLNIFLGALTLTGHGVINSSTTSTIQLSGNILGDSTAIALSDLQGTTTLQSSGSAASPFLLEAMSQDLGPVTAGFSKNFVYGALVLASNSYVKLVDLSDNASGTGAEAVYAQSVVVPSGSTLDLNGLHLYARAAQVDGTVLNGTIDVIPDSGPLTLGTSTPGDISTPGELDEWTFFGRGGRTMSILVNPGSSGSPAPLSPQLQWANVQLLDANNNVLASSANTSAGGIVSLSNVILPADGTYKIHVTAASSHTSATGNYLVSAWDVTPNVRTLNLGQQSVGSITAPFTLDQWNFSASAGQQIQFHRVGSSSPSVAFKLTGPGNYVAFQDITGDSPLINLPSSGNYALNVYGLNGTTGSYSFVVNQTSVTALPPGTVYNGAWAGSGQAQLFSVPVTAANPLSVILADAATSDHTEIYVRFGAPPTREIYDYAVNGAGSSHSLLLPQATPGTWYVLVYGESIPSSSGNFTLQVSSSEIVVTKSSTSNTAADINTILTVNGAGFNSGTQVHLIDSNGSVVATATSMVNSPTQITATFPAGTIPAGAYSIQVTQQDGASVQLPIPFVVAAHGQGVLSAHLDVPNAVGRHAPSTIYINYSNTGNAPMPAPLLILNATNPSGLSGALMTLDSSLQTAGFWTSATPVGYTQTIEILASGATPGILQPGESGRVPVYYAGWLSSTWDFYHPTLNFSLTSIKADDATPVDWVSKEASLQPSGISAAAWHVMYSALLQKLGTAAGGYVQLLDDSATYLGLLGESVTDITKLWSFAVAQTENLWPLSSFGSVTDDSMPTPGALPMNFSRAFNSTVPGRFQSSMLGLGWFTPWQQSLSVAADGTTTVTNGSGARYVYQPDSRSAGVYFSQPGDTSTFTSGNGGYLLTSVTGTITAFRPDGTLNYLQDNNGNKITTAYTDGKLTGLTASSGQSFTLAYNAAGLLSTLTDSGGRVTTYSYDASSQHLVSVTAYNGQVTSYAYNTTANSVAVNLLASIAFSDGTHQYLSYDDSGRLATTSADGGSLTKTFSYSGGQVSTTDALGNTSSLFFNENGQLAKTVDALGHPMYYTYDSSFNLAKVTNAFGASARYTHNSVGEVTSATDFLGNTTYFAYNGAHNQLSTLTDANGNVTRYNYNTAGSLLSTTYANGRTASSTHDPLGNALSFVNAAGEAIQYAHNAAGQLTSASFADGSSYTYAYDAQGRVTSATDANGAVTFTYNPTTGFLTKVAYPNELFLTFGYDAGGRRTSMADQSGFTTNYAYDAVGRLSTLKDGSGNTIVTYLYDATGRLSKKTNGNGTYSTYDYDGNGHVLHLINYTPRGTINSRFDDTYNALGLKTAETTLDGAWSYTYDANGQLTRAVFASNNAASSPNQDLAYNYDAMGNRISTVINGITTAYVANGVNQYASVGGVAYSYDAKGNLLSDGTNTYAYNVLNKLISVTNVAGTTTYSYNALGQRVGSVNNGQTTQNLLDPAEPNQIVGTFDSSGNNIAKYTYGVGLSSQVRSEGANFYDCDTGGSAVALTNSNGQNVNTYAYSPFGETIVSTGSSPNPFTFGGQGGVVNDGGAGFATPLGEYRADTGQFRLSVAAEAVNGTNVGNFESGPVSIPNGVGIVASAFGFGLEYGAAKNVTAMIAEAGRDAEPAAIAKVLPLLRFAKLLGATGLAADAVGVFFGDRDYAGIGIDTIAFFAGGPFWSGVAFEYHVIKTIVDASETNISAFDEAHPWAGDRLLGGRNWVYGLFANLFANVPTLRGGDYIGSTITNSVSARDPNAMYGPVGRGVFNFVTDLGSTFAYRITFENEATATAPAQSVTITNNLDANLDWSTFQLTGIGFGDNNLVIPTGSQHYQTTLAMTYNGQTFNVQIEAGLHSDTGQVYASFQSIDPNTSLPPANVLTGFLPPEDGTGRGQGYLTYTVSPKASLATGVVIPNVASIVFDAGEPITTDQVDPHDASKGTDTAKQARVTIDSVAPTSRVALLPLQSPDYFWVRWSGTDNATGVASYTIYVTSDGGVTWNVWLNNTTKTAAIFQGQPGKTYAFYSIARDGAGNVESKTVADTSTVTTTGSKFQGSVVVAMNDSVPGVSDAKFLLADSPAVDSFGDVAFKAFITGTTKTSPINKGNNTGIWFYTGTTGTLVARMGANATGTSGALLSSLSDPAMHEDGSVAFTGGLTGGDVLKDLSNSTGVWLMDGGTPRLMVRKGGTAADQPNTKYSQFAQIVTQQPSDIAFLATVAGTSGGKPTTSVGLWGADLSGALHSVIRAGESITTGTIQRTIAAINAFPTPTKERGQSRSVDTVDGRLTFGLTFADKSAAIFAATPKASGFDLESVAGTWDTTAPGIAQAKWSAFGNPAVNANGTIAFRGTVSGTSTAANITTSNNSGIWLDSGNTMTLVARTGDTAPDSGGAKFAALEEPVINNSEQIAFIGSLQPATNRVTAATAAGVWANTSGTMKLVARAGGTAAGVTGGKFASFDQIVLPDVGGPIFLATLTGVIKTMNTGVWSIGSDGQAHLLWQTGEVADVHGMPKVISSFSIFTVCPQVVGQSRNFDAATRTIAFLATFSDGTWAILQAVAP